MAHPLAYPLENGYKNDMQNSLKGLSMGYKNRLKYTFGWVLSKLFPKKTIALNRSFTIPDYSWTSQQTNHTVDRLIRFYLGQVAGREERRVPGKLESIHKNFWQEQDIFYNAAQRRLEEVYVPAYQSIVQSLTPVLIDKGIRVVCEFGTGDGQWLNYLSSQWQMIKRFIGIDLSGRQIEINRSKYNHLEFYKEDLLEWAEQKSLPKTLYHTNSGVLEYLSEKSVVRLFEILKHQARGSLLLLIEPLYGDFSLNEDVSSKVNSSEYSYTHNYVYLLQLTGIKLVSYEEKNVLGVRMLVVQAYVDE